MIKNRLTPRSIATQILFGLLLWNLVTPLQAAEESCLKVVFKQYCLGGSLETLLAEQPQAEQSRSAQGMQLKIKQSNQLLIIDAEKGKIVRISRQQPPGRWINFETWKRKLVRLYHKPEVLGSFPAYASSRSARLNAIRAKKGFAHNRWSQTHWFVELIWDNPDHILLSYQLDDKNSSTLNDDDL